MIKYVISHILTRDGVFLRNSVHRHRGTWHSGTVAPWHCRHINSNQKPKVAIRSKQGSNGHVAFIARRSCSSQPVASSGRFQQFEKGGLRRSRMKWRIASWHRNLPEVKSPSIRTLLLSSLRFMTGKDVDKNLPSAFGSEILLCHFAQLHPSRWELSRTRSYCRWARYLFFQYFESALSVGTHIMHKPQPGGRATHNSQLASEKKNKKTCL